MEILERAHSLEADGVDVVHLEVGEPDFPSPPGAIKAGIAAMQSGRTHYTHSMGIGPLRERIAENLSATSGRRVDPGRVVVTTGSSAGLLLAFAALLDPGDELLLADPGYPCYTNIARTLGIVPVPVPAGPEAGFVLDVDAVAERVGPRTRALVVNSPANPTGAVTPPDTLRALTALGPAVVSDEIYAGLAYEGTVTSALAVHDDAIVVGGFSKRYAMTGWRLGYLVVPERLVDVVRAMQQNLYISASDFGQWAALAALDEGEAVEAMRARFDERRRLLVESLPGLGLPVPVVPRGAFYVFADARAYSRDSMALALDLLERAHVAVAPGIDFGPGGEGFLRFSYATSLERIEEGLRRLADYFSAS